MNFHPTAHWIWSDRATRPYNNFVAFRRTIEISGEARDPILRITADARYEVFVNGQWVGHGPNRSWPSPWSVDVYDLRSHLCGGRNVVAVLVHDIGIGTFQYLLGEPGLLAEIEWTDGQNQKRLIGTDGSWRATPHAGHVSVVPRISVQQAWEEQYDARAFDPNWRGLNYDDSTWPGASVKRAAGEGSHKTFEVRDIPFLTRQTVEPTALLEAVAVRPAEHVVSINLRELHNPDDKTANIQTGRMLCLSYVHSPAAQPVQFQFPHGRANLKLNGKRLADDGTAKLKSGGNVLMVEIGSSHGVQVVFALHAAKPVRFSTRPGEATDDTGFLVIGPIHVGERGESEMPPYAAAKPVEGATTEVLTRIWESGPKEDDLSAPYARVVPPHVISPVDVYATCYSERVDPKKTPVVEDPSALQRDTPDWTTIHPVNAGAGVRILLDLGDELVGYHEFEIDAPEGAIIDNHNFEFIQYDGRRNYAEGMNNSFRYVCREGVQRYRTFVRRGFRYSYFTFRDFHRPIRVRFIRAIFSSYPQARLGAFACSDPTLSRIWEVGAHSVHCCSEDTYTDCPSYEQTHWVGDARNEALVDLMANGDPRLSKHCWIQTGRSLDRSVITESEVPSGWENVLPTWTFLWMRWAQEHYQLTGDAAFAKEALDILDRNARGIEKCINKNGLFELLAWNLFDWAAMDQPNDGVVTHISCLCVLGLRQTAQFAEQFGQKQRAKRWSALADRVAAAVNKHLWDQKKKAFIDCIRKDGTRSPIFSQQTQTAAYISGVATGDRAKRCLKMIENPPRGFVKAGSPFFMFFALEGYAREGRWMEMIETIRSYWGIQIDKGATTTWETYDAAAARHTRSHCHGWSAAPTYFLSTYVLGVQPARPGFEEILVAPRVGDLKWAHGRVPTPHGAVTVYWKRSGKKLWIDLTLPTALPTRLELPATGKIKVLNGSAKKIGSSKGATILATKGARTTLEIG